jgi:hypothetical protein
MIWIEERKAEVSWELSYGYEWKDTGHLDKAFAAYGK